MGLQLEDGKGRGYSAAVNSSNRLLTTGIAASPEHQINHENGEAYNVLFSATPTGAGDCFFYMKNTSEKDLILEGMGIWLAANEYLDIKLGDSGTPIGGTTVTPVNLNSGSGITAAGTFQQGNDITGLSGGVTAIRKYHATSNASTYYNFNADIVLKKNGVFTLYCQTGTTALAGYVVMYYKKTDY